MIESKAMIRYVIIGTVMFVTLILLQGIESEIVSGADPDEPVVVNLYLQSRDGTDYFMNSEQDDPADDNAVTELEWEYGWWEEDHVADQELLADLYIEGTMSLGNEIYVELSVTNPSFTQDVDVTIQFLDNGEVIAETTETLQDLLSGSNENSVWRLPFNNNADGPNHHTFKKDHTMSVHLTTDGGNVNVDYRNGDAHVEFITNQIEEEEFFVEDENGNDMSDEEFIPLFPEKTGSGIAHIHGSLLDAFTYRDIASVELIIEGPAQTITPGPIPVENRSSDDKAVFHFNWTISDDMHSEEDAGEYLVTIVIYDQNDNNFTYEKELRFIVSKYGAYIELGDGESDTKQGEAGESVYYRMVLFNVGLIDNERFDFSFPGLPEEWDAREEPTPIVLDSGDQMVIDAIIFIPESAKPGESAEVKVTATSSNSTKDPSYDEASWYQLTTTIVGIHVDIDVFYREQDSEDDNSNFIDIRHKDAEIHRDSVQDYSFRVINGGSQEDEIVLSASGVNEGWDAIFVDPDSGGVIDSVTLEPNDEILLYARVTSPSGYENDDFSDLVMTGISSTNDSVSDSVYLALLIPNEAPIANIESISPSPAMENENVQFNGAGQDNDGTIETYLWHSSIEGTLYEGSKSTFTTSDLSLGEHDITLKVKDNEDAWSDEESTTLIIHDRPVAEIISISPTPAAYGEEVYFEGSGSDQDGIARYVWVSSIDGEISNGSEADFSISTLSPGSHLIVLMVEDINGGRSFDAEDSIIVEPPNSIPRIRIISPIENATIHGIVFLAGSVFDIDGMVEHVELTIQNESFLIFTTSIEWNFEWDTRDA